MQCRICGHFNRSDALRCAHCGRSMDEVGGVRRPLHCPRCGTLNALGVVMCRLCKVDLTPVDRLPPEALTLHCPHCLADNPPPTDLSIAVFCIGCGREIHFPGQSRLIGLTELPATPGADVCPRCRQKARPLSDLHLESPATWLTRQLAPPSRPWILDIGEDLFEPADSVPRSTSGAGGHGEILVLDQPDRRDGRAGRLAALLRRMVWRLGVGGLRTYRRRKQCVYGAALDRWSRAHYCSTDSIVFVRRGTAVSETAVKGCRRWLWSGEYP
jgi:hypothetical protein